MLRVILFSVLISITSVSLAQELRGFGAGVVTSISPQGRELIIDEEIYFLPGQIEMDGVTVTRSRVASLLRPGDEIMVELEKERTVKAIHSRLQ